MKKGEKHTKGAKRKIKEAVEKEWKNEDSRKKRIKNIKESIIQKYKDEPEYHKNVSIGIQKFWDEHPEAKENLSEIKKGMISHNKNKTKENYEPLRKISKKLKGKPKLEEHRKNIGLANKGRISPMKDKKQSKYAIEKLKEIMKKNWNNKDYKEKQIKAILEGLLKRPTSFEKKISELCIENSLPFVYTGDGRFLINFKNPDFVNHRDKVVIEVFYSWFKIRDYGSIENYKDYCRKKYNPKGWRVIFIDENEVDVDNWKELCLNKITNSGGLN